MSASWSKHSKARSDDPVQPTPTATAPAANTWRDVLNADVGCWIQRICYGVCTPRPWQGGSLVSSLDAPAIRQDGHPLIPGVPADLWLERHRMNNGMCWNSPMAWGRGIDSGGGMMPLALMEMEDDST